MVARCDLALPSLGLLLLASPALAQDLTLDDATPLRGHAVRQWRMADGLPQNSINDLAQTRDGHLWLATFGGLVRFDGRSFEVFDLTSGLPSPRITAVAASADGRLAIGHQRQGVTLWGPSGFERPPPLDDPHARAIWSLAWRDRELWTATSSGAFVLLREAQAVRVLDGPVQYVRAEGPSAVVVGTSQEVLRFEGHEPGARITAGFTWRVRSRDGGGRWLQDQSGLRFEAGDTRKDVVRWPRHKSAPPTAPVFDERGGLWFTVGARLYRLPRASAVARGVEPARLEVQRIGAPVRRLLRDRERNLWVGSDGAGLWRLQAHPFESLSVQLGLPSRPARGVLPDADGGFWVADDCRGVAHVTDSGVRTRHLDGQCVGALARSRDGGPWVGALGVSRLTAQGPEPLDSTRDIGPVSALLEDSRGRLWIGTELGALLRFDESGLESVVKGRDPVTALTEAPDGSVWAGLRSRVIRVGPSNIETLTEEDGVPPGQVRALWVRDSHETWVGTYGGGLARLRGGEHHRFGPRDGLPDAFISGIRVDDDRRIWLNTNRGVVRLPIETFDAFATGDEARLRANVLPTGEAMAGRPSMAWDASGRLLVTTIAGVVRVSPSLVAKNPAVPYVRIDRARLDGAPLTLDGPNERPPGAGVLDVGFSAALLRAPEQATFEYRLRGLDDGWRRVEAPGRARFEALAPGAYVLEVFGLNESGRAGPIVSVPFTLAPHFHETLLFRGGLGLLFVTLLLGGHRARTRVMKRQNRVLTTEVAQRRRAEASMEASERHYRRIFETSVSGVFVVDREHRVVDVNPRACDLLLRPREEILGAHVWPLLEGTASDEATSRPPSAAGPEVRLCRRSDGTDFEANILEAPLSVVERLITVTDVSDVMQAQAQEQRMREQLLHSQRVEAVGRLAGGVAHEVNNLLTAIQGYADLAKDTLEHGGDRESAIEMIDEVRQGAKQTAQVTRQLLDFARQGPADVQALDLGPLLRQLDPMLRRLKRDDIELSIEVQPDLPPVQADATQVEQIVLNLVINALDAMPSGGTVAIGADQVDAKATQDIVLGEAHAHLFVEDDGVGMTPEILNRVFDPFFTTKDIGEGTGLGLSAVHGIVTQAGGHITVKSERGAGTRFDVYLPISSEPVRTPSPTPPMPLRVPQKSRVLYVDDDANVADATRRMLERRGYDVRCCGHPAEALERALEMQEDLPILITDVVMPGLNGRELSRRIQARHPDLRVLYVSGYSANVLEELGPNERFLPKPYNPRRLFSALDELMGIEPEAGDDAD